jgi:pyruvate kinase
MSNTKIVVTLGPASESLETVKAMMHAGARIFRLNASHGPWADHQRRIETVRLAEKETGQTAAVLLDLQGPKIRLGTFAEGKIRLETGAHFTITTEKVLGDATRASTTYASFAVDVRVGDRVLLNDGAVTLRALENDGVSVKLEVLSGGVTGNQKGINLPGVAVSAPSLTEKDREDLKAGLAVGVDLIALSFVRRGEDIRFLRFLMGDAKTPVVAKIEKAEALEDIDSILREANGIMVARGDLGVEMSLEAVPPIQKMLIREARSRSRFVITATQMLESMIENANPTRAEVSDVANAIYDGSDAVMLSAETSVGKFPVNAVQYMARIAAEAERDLNRRGFHDTPRLSGASDSEIVADAAYNAARAADVQAIVVFTTTGYSARLVSRYRPPVRVIAMTESEMQMRRLLVNYAVVPVLSPPVRNTDEMLEQMDSLLVNRGYLQAGSKVVFVAGQPVGRSGSTNLMKLHRVSG